MPVGLSYFEGDRFRGRCVIEFGAPIVPGPELREEYAAEKAADPLKAGYLKRVEEFPNHPNIVGKTVWR
mgnify:CR=1 FL=1